MCQTNVNALSMQIGTQQCEEYTPSIPATDVWLFVYSVFHIRTFVQPNMILSVAWLPFTVLCMFVRIELAHSCCSTVMRMWNYLKKKNWNRLFVMVTFCTIRAIQPVIDMCVCVCEWTVAFHFWGIFSPHPFMPLMLNAFNRKNWKNNFLLVASKNMWFHMLWNCF